MSLRWVAVGLCVAAAPGPQPWWGAGLPAGPQAVGFATQFLTDSTRFVGGHARIVQLAVWYPATAAAPRRVTYADYLHAAAAETTSVDTASLGQRNVDAFCALLLSRSVPESLVNRWFRAPMLAARDAKPAPGAFPLVLVAQGNGESAVDQSVLGEYLASYGYVVATSPSQARITGQPARDSDVAAAAEDQARDLAVLRFAMGGRSGVAAAGGLAVVAHSFGARSALLYAMRDSIVQGIVSLDGGIGTATARAAFELAPSFHADAAHAPVLHFYERLDPFMAPEWGTLRRLVHAPVWVAATKTLHHHHFTSLGAASGAYSAVRDATRATAQTGPEYAAVLELTRAFLDGIMRHDWDAFDRAAADSTGLRPRRLGKVQGP